MEDFIQRLNDFAARMAHDLTPLLQALADALPKPKIIDRRRLSKRRARRRTERKMLRNG